MKILILKTKRLILRPLKIGDEKTITPFANNEKISRFLTFDTPVTLEKEAKYVAERVRKFGKSSFTFIVFEKKDKSFVGLIDLHNYHAQYKKAEVGLWVAETKWRNGFGEEIVRAVFDFGFSKLKLNRIGYCVFKGNLASEKLIRKIGAKFEGTTRKAIIKNGKAIDQKQFSILREEWNFKRKRVIK